MRMAWLGCVVVLAVMGCRQREAGPGAPARQPRVVAASYEYEATDEQGQVLVQGRLLLPEVSDGDQFAGTWEIRFVGGDDAQRAEAGPQIGSGRLIGRRSGEEIQIDLNPHMRDNNVALNGTISEQGFTGRWQFVTLVGPTSGGTFTALRR